MFPAIQIRNLGNILNYLYPLPPTSHLLSPVQAGDSILPSLLPISIFNCLVKTSTALNLDHCSHLLKDPEHTHSFSLKIFLCITERMIISKCIGDHVTSLFNILQHLQLSPGIKILSLLRSGTTLF